MSCSRLLNGVALAVLGSASGLGCAVATPSQGPPLVSATELSFAEVYRLPVGPRGLEPSQKLVGLAGQSVRMRGYMVEQAEPTSGVFLLSPLPVQAGDQDEGLADDLPASVIFVHESAPGSGDAPPYRPGVLQVTGILELGPANEADGRVSHVRLRVPALGPPAVQELGASAFQSKP